MLNGIRISHSSRVAFDIPTVFRSHSLSLITRTQNNCGKRQEALGRDIHDTEHKLLAADEERGKEKKKISKNYFIDIFFHTQQVSHDTNVRQCSAFFFFIFSLSFFFCLLLSPPRPHRSFRLNEACENVVVQKEIFSITWSRARLDFMIHSSTTPTDRCKVGSRSLSLSRSRFTPMLGQPASKKKEDISTLSHFFIWCGYPSVLISCCCRLRAYWGANAALLHRNGSFLLLSRSALWNYSLSCNPTSRVSRVFQRRY